MPVGRLLLACVLLALTACRSEPAARWLPIEPVDGRIDLATSIPGSWDRVCFLQPYTTNGMAREALGFVVDVQGRSDIATSDSIALAVTAQGDTVVDLFEIPRRPSSFTGHHGQCFARTDAKFRVPENGYPHASHRRE